MTDFADRAQLGQASGRAIDRARKDIQAIGEEIFEHPEPALSETRAARLLTDFLASSGFEIQSNLADMPTAFQATARNFDSEAMRKGLRHGHVAILAEYDADEDGHLSGRHLVASGAIATAVGLAEVLRGVHGQVMIIGCPAAAMLEGKRRLAAAGVFEPADAALGSAPASTGKGFQPIINNTGGTLASARVLVRFEGASDETDARQRLTTAAESLAHDFQEPESLAAAPTETGINLDIRCSTNPQLDEAVARLRDLAERVAADTGSVANVDVQVEAPAFNVNRILARRVKTFADTLSLKQEKVVKTPLAGPSDWGHVSLVASTTRAVYPISESDVEIGTPEFAEASRSDFAYQQMLTCAKAVALAGLDLLGDMELRGFAEGELIRSTKAQGLTRVPRRWLGVHPVKPREASNGHVPVWGSGSTQQGKRS